MEVEYWCDSESLPNTQPKVDKPRMSSVRFRYAYNNRISVVPGNKRTPECSREEGRMQFLEGNRSDNQEHGDTTCCSEYTAYFRAMGRIWRIMM